jgi:hypothetical protein
MNTTHTPPAFDLSLPVYTIESIAILLHVSVDTARQYTYRKDFPAPRVLGARNLWVREEVLAWFAALPRRTKRLAGAEAEAVDQAPLVTKPKSLRRRHSSVRSAA